ncbi:unnamed protein product [Arabis nemorensis]|uniref:Uncharacterized protein n=1 Tax=Arabis nemorensis TaxID=586526 RepID=A0A565BU32_9BRAS|nr:unnamed protein product [Arabis nemorensis]
MLGDAKAPVRRGFAVARLIFLVKALVVHASTAISLVPLDGDLVFLDWAHGLVPFGWPYVRNWLLL